MILSTHGVLASQIASFDADAQAFFNRVTTAGGSLSNTEKVAVNQLVLDMKSYGIWTSMKAVYPMVGASASACKQNLVSSSFTGTFSSGWTFASTGVTPNGTSAYFDTNFNQSSNLSTNNNHIALYIRTNLNGGSFPNLNIDSGITDDVAYSFSMILSRTNGNFEFQNGSQNTSNAVADSLGFYLGSALNTGTKSYKNGSTIGTNSSTQTRSLFNNNIYIGATNKSSTNTATHFSQRQNAFSSIGNGLTDTQASNFYTAVQAFQTTLSRQV